MNLVSIQCDTILFHFIKRNIIRKLAFKVKTVKLMETFDHVFRNFENKIFIN